MSPLELYNINDYNFNSLNTFTEWYLSKKLPMIPPKDGCVLLTEKSTSVSIFKYKQFQVELYLVSPGLVIDQHEHPFMESKVFLLNTGSLYDGISELNYDTNWGNISPTLLPGQSHGRVVDSRQKTGGTLLVIQKWLDNQPVTSAAANWKGLTEGPLHISVIKKYYPKAYINKSGFADVTKNDS